jgi:hypothetical protein
MTYSRFWAATTALFAVATLSGTAVSAQGRGRGQANSRKPHPQPAEVSAQEQQQRIADQKHRDADYQQKLNVQLRAAQSHAAQMQSKKRTAQYAYTQQYAQRLQQQQQQLQQQQVARDYSRDPYFAAPATYRYTVSGTTRQTNQYGVDVLRQAVNTGYQQGVLAGQADRRDGATSSYQNSFAYQDANYGYAGQYVAQGDYNYYFRQGFRRGYQDGYGSRSQYGTVSNGNASILGSLLTSILGLKSIP